MSPVLVLVGPTAVGKTALSLELAENFGCEIISMDSMQVYRHMDIGTAKATAAERVRVRHHLIDIADPDEQYNAARFVTDARAAMADMRRRGKMPLITGGTGLYLKALNHGLFAAVPIPAAIRDGLRLRLAEEGRAALFRELADCDPESAARIHPNDTQRILRGLEVFQASGRPWSEYLRRQEQDERLAGTPQLLLGLRCERSRLYERIRLRTEKMMQPPFRAEVENLLAMGYDASLPSMQALGYRHMIRHIEGEWPLETACAALATDTRRYAKRQLTWFRSEAAMHWFDRDEGEAIFRLVARFVHENPLSS